MAASSDFPQRLHRLVDQLEDQQLSLAADALDTVHENSMVAVLRDVPGIRMPDHWPPRFPDVEPLTVSDEPASEQLIRDRR
jgi:hypothetical protein